jgi:hypothetical protein
MITGKDDARICYARKAVDHFLEQDYKYKKLIIINHHPEKSVNTAPSTPAVFEFRVPKQGNTLGDLRNIALQLVPIDGIWTVWDDDDYRETQYLSTLYDKLISSGSDVVVFTNRYECNYKNKFVWEMQLRTGFVLVFAKQDLRFRYMSKDSMEDTHILDHFRQLGKKIHVYENTDNPMLYIRLVHSNNTSLYVDKEKKEIIQATAIKNTNYSEKQVDQATQDKVLSIVAHKFDINGHSCDLGV